jgi:hypothetical protein
MIYTLEGTNARLTQERLFQIERAFQDTADCRNYPAL